MIKQLSVVIIAAAFAGCFTPTPQNGALTCNANGKACPDGYYCAGDNHCWKTGAADADKAWRGAAAVGITRMRS